MTIGHSLDVCAVGLQLDAAAMALDRESELIELGLFLAGVVNI